MDGDKTNVRYNEAIAFEGDLNLSIKNASFHIETRDSESDETSQNESFASDFVADQCEMSVAAQTVNKAVFLRNTSDNPSVGHLKDTKISVVAGAGSRRDKRIRKREQKRLHRPGPGASQTHNYAALIRNSSSSSTANLTIEGGSSIKIRAGGSSSGGRNEAIGIDGGGNFTVIGGSIEIASGGAEDVEEELS